MSESGCVVRYRGLILLKMWLLWLLLHTQAHKLRDKGRGIEVLCVGKEVWRNSVPLGKEKIKDVYSMGAD